MEQKIKYVLTDGKNYVTLNNTNRPKMTEKETDAFLFKKTAAKNFLTSIPKALSGIEWQIQPVDESKFPQSAPTELEEVIERDANPPILAEESANPPEKPVSEKKQAAVQKRPKRRPKNKIEEGQVEKEQLLTLQLEPENSDTEAQPDEESLEAWVLEIQEKLLFLRKRLKELKHEYSHTMLELTDIYHKVELSRFNVVEGYKLCKQLQDCLQRRRNIKNEQEQIEKILSCSFAECANGKLEQHFELMKNRQYKPRVLTDLFEDFPEE